MVSVTHLRAFHFVALSGGYSQAAREMAVSQSTLSAHVRQLEAISGTILFERGPRGTSMTSEGEALFAVTSRLFQVLSEASGLLNSRRVEGGHLRIATDGTSHTLPILKALRQQRPNMTFAIQLHNSDSVIEHILQYRVDVGISAFPPKDPRLYVKPLMTMRIGIFMPASHEWAQRSSIPLQELAGLNLVLRETGSRTRSIFEQHLARQQIATGSNIEVSSSEGVRETVAAGFGIGVIANFEFRPDPRLSFVLLEGADKTIDEYVVCLEERRRLPMVAEFFKSAATVFGNKNNMPE